MKRPLLSVAILSVGASFVLAGCEPWHGQSVRKDRPEASTSSGTNDMDASIPKGEHSSGLSRGTWSREARDIESHFNVR